MLNFLSAYRIFHAHWTQMRCEFESYQVVEQIDDPDRNCEGSPASDHAAYQLDCRPATAEIQDHPGGLEGRGRCLHGSNC